MIAVNTRPVAVISLCLFVSSLIGVIGAILIWSSTCCVSTLERWTVGFLVLAIGVNLLAQFANLQSGFVLSSAIVIACVDSAYGYSRTQYYNHTETLIGYLLLALGTVGSFAALPVTVKIPRQGSVIHFTVCCICVLLVLGNVFLLVDGRSVLHPIALALLHLCGCCWDCGTVVDFAFFAASFVLYNDWLAVIVSTGAALVGWVIVCVGLVLLIIVHMRFIVLIIPDRVEAQRILE